MRFTSGTFPAEDLLVEIPVSLTFLEVDQAAGDRDYRVRFSAKVAAQTPNEVYPHYVMSQQLFDDLCRKVPFRVCAAVSHEAAQLELCAVVGDVIAGNPATDPLEMSGYLDLRLERARRVAEVLSVYPAEAQDSLGGRVPRGSAEPFMDAARGPMLRLHAYDPNHLLILRQGSAAEPSTDFVVAQSGVGMYRPIEAVCRDILPRATKGPWRNLLEVLNHGTH